jgi:hypothetical protein
VPGAPTAGIDSSGTGWSFAAIELDVIALPDSQTLRVTGRLTCVAPAGGSRGPDLVLAREGMRFESVRADDVTLDRSAAGDSVRVRFARVVAGGRASHDLFRLRAPHPRLARAVLSGQKVRSRRGTGTGIRGSRRRKARSRGSAHRVR